MVFPNLSTAALANASNWTPDAVNQTSPNTQGDDGLSLATTSMMLTGFVGAQVLTVLTGVCAYNTYKRYKAAHQTHPENTGPQTEDIPLFEQPVAIAMP